MNSPTSNTTQKNLDDLVASGILPTKPLIQSSAPPDGDVPWGINVNQQVVFRWLFIIGFDLHCCSFFRGLLYFIGLKFVNLNPNSILHIACFIHLCYAFLAVLPHFNLFRYLFYLRPLPSTNNRNAFSGSGFQERKVAEYFSILLFQSMPNWIGDRFICDNLKIALPPYQAKVAPVQDCWNLTGLKKKLAQDHQVKAMLKKIVDLKEKGITTETIVWGFVSRSSQPLKCDAKPTWAYTRTDPTEERTNLPHLDQITARIEMILDPVGFKGLSKVKLAFNYNTVHPVVKLILLRLVHLFMKFLHRSNPLFFLLGVE